MDKQPVYIVAVSGGVDSVVLLHKLINRKQMNDIYSPKYIVAHFNHGTRNDNLVDKDIVEKLANEHDLIFEYGEEKLGTNVSEADARQARYLFLRSIKDKYKADKIITAHHQDDVLETMILNIMRGTGPRGLNPMQGYDDLLRPLINRTKKELIDYGLDNKLAWHEDSTNNDERYKRNYVRKNITPKLESKKTELLKIKQTIGELYYDIDAKLDMLMPKQNVIHRSWFLKFPYSIQKEIIRRFLIRCGLDNIDYKTIERLAISVKTLPTGKMTDISGSLWLKSEKDNVLIISK